jgi:hypothetical protein
VLRVECQFVSKEKSRISVQKQQATMMMAQPLVIAFMWHDSKASILPPHDQEVLQLLIDTTRKIYNVPVAWRKFKSSLPHFIRGRWDRPDAV